MHETQMDNLFLFADILSKRSTPQSSTKVVTLLQKIEQHTAHTLKMGARSPIAARSIDGGIGARRDAQGRFRDARGRFTTAPKIVRVKSAEVVERRRQEETQKKTGATILSGIKEGFLTIGSKAFDMSKGMTGDGTAQDAVGAIAGEGYYGAVKELKDATSGLIGEGSMVGGLISKIGQRVGSGEEKASPAEAGGVKRDGKGRFIEGKPTSSLKLEKPRQDEVHERGLEATGKKGAEKVKTAWGVPKSPSLLGALHREEKVGVSNATALSATKAGREVIGKGARAGIEGVRALGPVVAPIGKKMATGAGATTVLGAKSTSDKQPQTEILARGAGYSGETVELMKAAKKIENKHHKELIDAIRGIEGGGGGEGGGSKKGGLLSSLGEAVAAGWILKKFGGRIIKPVVGAGKKLLAIGRKGGELLGKGTRAGIEGVKAIGPKAKKAVVGAGKKVLDIGRKGKELLGKGVHAGIEGVKAIGPKTKKVVVGAGETVLSVGKKGPEKVTGTGIKGVQAMGPAATPIAKKVVTGADSAVSAATKGIGKKAIGKVAGIGMKGLKVLGPIAALASAGYDAYQGYNDTEMQKEAFSLKKGQKATTGQKVSTAFANVVDMGGIGTGLLNALGVDVSTADLARKTHEAGAWFGDLFSTEGKEAKPEGSRKEKKRAEIMTGAQGQAQAMNASRTATSPQSREKQMKLEGVKELTDALDNAVRELKNSLMIGFSMASKASSSPQIPVNFNIRELDNIAHDV